MWRQSVWAVTVAGACLLHTMERASAAEDADGSQAHWIKLADRTAGSGLETATVVVGRQATAGWFSRIRLTATGGDLLVQEIRIYFADGDMQRLPGPARVARETRPASFPIEGGARPVDHIEMTYKGVSWSRQPVVAGLWAELVAGRDAASPPGPASFDADWELLGKQVVGPAVAQDVIAIGRHEGRFDAVRLRVLGGDVAFHDIRVVYRDGNTETLAMRRLVRGGDASPPLSLSGEAQFIDKIELVHEADPQAREPTVVQVWARRPDR